MNVVLALCDPSDTVALFVPYYFNHLMAFQMTGITNILLGHSDPETLYPDLSKTSPADAHVPVETWIVVSVLVSSKVPLRFSNIH